MGQNWQWHQSLGGGCDQGNPTHLYCLWPPGRKWEWEWKQVGRKSWGRAAQMSGVGLDTPDPGWKWKRWDFQCFPSFGIARVRERQHQLLILGPKQLVDGLPRSQAHRLGRGYSDQSHLVLFCFSSSHCHLLSFQEHPFYHPHLFVILLLIIEQSLSMNSSQLWPFILTFTHSFIKSYKLTNAGSLASITLLL